MTLFQQYINKAINEIKLKNFQQAIKNIDSAILEDDVSPKTHNLLGIIAEFNGDLDLAIKHYRAACALDPSFKSSCKNLTRITSFNYIFNSNDIDFGNIIEKEDKTPYVVKYNSNNIGHFYKKHIV